MDKKENNLNGRKNKTSSIAKMINWDMWLRQMVALIVLDLILVGVAVMFFFVESHKKVPDSAYEKGGLFEIAKEETEIDFITKRVNDKNDIIYRVTTANGDIYESSVREYSQNLWPLFLTLIIAENIWMLFEMFNTRRIRRRMRPLYDVALQADAVSKMADMAAKVNEAPVTPDKDSSGKDNISESNMRHLESAINRADPNAPLINTGDKELRGIEIALNNLLRQMQESRKQQIRFVSDASHELRTPIAVIQGYVNMLDRWGKQDTEVLEESIEALKNESEHMKELVEQLLFLARGDSGRNTLQRTDFDMAKVIYEVWEESCMIDESHVYNFYVDDKKVTELYTDDAVNPDEVYNGPEFTVNGDIAMVKQSARIFIQNAAKYSPKGSEIKLRVRRNKDNSVSYMIQDEGIGLKQEQLDHIFERFYRSDEARNADSGGTGRGLSIAKWIIDAHEAKVKVLSREDFGTRFTVIFKGVSQNLNDESIEWDD